MYLKHAFLLLALTIHLATSDFVCTTTGNFGCNLKCSLYKRGSGSCQNIDERKKCVCLEEEVEEKIDEASEETTTIISIVEDEEESFWKEVDVYDEYFKEKENEDKESYSKKDEDNKYLSWILKKLIFFPAERKGFFGFLQDIEKPSTFGLNNAVNFRIPCENGSLGAWFISPLGENEKALSELNSNDTLALYLHGSSATRGYSHRVEMYRKLTGMGYYVLTFDYRGYADSTDVKISDDEKPLFLVWGHSLGTAIGTNSLLQWQNSNSELRVHGLVLESPFNNMEDEIHRFALGRFMTGWLGQNHTGILMSVDAEFRSSDYLPQLQAPTLILHADNDRLVPSYLGERLYKSAIDGGKNNTRFVLFPADMKLGHKYIYSAPGLAAFIKDLEQEARDYRQNQTIIIS